MEQREKLNELGNKILNASRTELYLKMRFMGPALGSLGFKMDLATRSVGTDAAYIRFNPSWLCEVYLEQPRRIHRAYMHMLMHCLFRHMFSSSEETHDNSMLWDLASDIAAEAAVDSMDCPLLVRSESALREEWYARLRKDIGFLTAEKIYKYLEDTFLDMDFDVTKLLSGGVSRPGPGEMHVYIEHPFKSEELGDLFEKLEAEFTVDDHQFWERLRKEDPDKDPDTPTPQMPDLVVKRDRDKKEEWEKTAKRVESEIETARLASTETGSLSKVLRFSLRKQTSLGEYLKKYTVLREEAEVDPDSFDYGLYNFGMEFYGNMPLIEENEFREARRIDELVIAIDTSGSTQGGLIQGFLNEIAAVLSSRENFFHRVNLHVIECDDKVQRDEVITEMDDLRRYADGFTVTGGYGTDFRPVFRYVDDLMKSGQLTNLRGLLYFTDGYGTYPVKPTPYETAFVFLPGGDSSAENVPDWAVKIYTE